LLDLLRDLKEGDKDWSGALKAYEEAQAIRTVLHNDAPEDSAWEPSLATSLINIAGVKFARGDRR